MKTTAALLIETGRPLELVELEIPVLKSGQVLVEVGFSGVCHTQLLECRGHRGEDKFLPHCLGHEGSGLVVEVGPGVTKVKIGDPVVLSWIKGSGADVPGSVYQSPLGKVNAGAVTTFGRHSVVSENRLTVIPLGLPMNLAALLGCAVPTGMGAVLNTAVARPGQSLVVFGTGGVGLCAVMGAALSGCHPIVAVDLYAERLQSALSMGATHAVPAGAGAQAALLEIAPQGFDVAIETSGRPEVMAQAVASVRSQGGNAVIVGNARHGEMIMLDPRLLNQGKRLLGTWGGDSQPDRDYPRYARLAAAGKLNLKPLLAKVYRLSEINLALDDLEQGRGNRPLVDLSLA